MPDENNFIPPYALNTPVLFLVFNRLDTTKQVFEAIRQAKPPRLYIAADGARDSKEGEADKVQTVRNFVMQNIDWDCEVKTLFREKNLGCKYAVSGAITWFFQNEEQGIILEDDCLPSQSFFWYCEELLNKYKSDNTVFLVSGDSRGTELFANEEDYGFCKYPLIWGWASWARVWDKYDPEMSDWPLCKKGLFEKISNYKPTIDFWKKNFESMYEKKIDTWDYQFSYLLLKNNAKCIVPKFNLIKNVGFGEGATHTFSVDSAAANRKSYEINLPLNHIVNISLEEKINKYFDKNEFSQRPFLTRAVNKLSRIFSGKNIL